MSYFLAWTGEEKRRRATFITQATDLLFLQNRSEDFVRFSLLVSPSVFVYGTSLVIPLNYFGLDVQRRNDKFERIILVNLRLAVHVEKRSLKKLSTEKKRIERNKDAFNLIGWILVLMLMLMLISHQFPLMFSCASASACACRYLTSENQALPSSLPIKQSFPATHKFLNGQIIGNSIKTRIYMHIHFYEVLFPRQNNYFFPPNSLLKSKLSGWDCDIVILLEVYLFCSIFNDPHAKKIYPST